MSDNGIPHLPSLKLQSLLGRLGTDDPADAEHIAEWYTRRHRRLSAVSLQIEETESETVVVRHRRDR